MKKTLLFLTVVLSFTYTFGANQLVPKKTNINNIVYTGEKTNHPSENCCVYNLTDNETNQTLLIDEGEPLDFDHTKYLPVGFNPSKEFNSLFLDKIKWVDDVKDEVFDFDRKQYLPVGFNPEKEFNHLFLNKIPWVEEEELD